MANRPAARPTNRFEAAGFTRAAEPVKKRLICAIDGLEKTGKSHFALSMPEPIGVIDIDYGLDGVIQHWQDDREIYVRPAGISLDELKSLTKDEAQKSASKAYDGVLKAYTEIMGFARSIVIDNATELWELVRIAHFGKLDHVKPHHYGPVNQEFRSFIRAAYDQGTTNLMLLHKVKDEYVDDKRTGVKIRAGFSDTGYLVQVNASTWRERGASVPDCFHLTVTDCRQNAEMNDMDLSGADLNFQTLATMVFPGTKPEEWL